MTISQVVNLCACDVNSYCEGLGYCLCNWGRHPYGWVTHGHHKLHVADLLVFILSGTSSCTNGWYHEIFIYLLVSPFSTMCVQQTFYVLFSYVGIGRRWLGFFHLSCTVRKPGTNIHIWVLTENLTWGLQRSCHCINHCTVRSSKTFYCTQTLYYENGRHLRSATKINTNKNKIFIH